MPKIKTYLINKRKIPQLKRYLLVFEVRRFIFNLYNDRIFELYCLMDIWKVYKSAWEKDISQDEELCFSHFLNIYLSNLLNIKDELLLNIDKNLFLIPLKYYTKFFALQNNPLFDSVFLNIKVYVQKIKIFLLIKY